MRETVPVYHPKTQQTSYQSPFAKNEYLQHLLRVALPGRRNYPDLNQARLTTIDQR